MVDLLTIKEIGHNPIFVFYEKRTPGEPGSMILYSSKFLEGITTDKNRVIHKRIGLNQFLRKKTTIPKGFNKKRKDPDKKWLKEYFYDSSRTPIQKKTVEELKKGYKWYNIHDNGGTPFIVYISPDEKDVSVYTVPKDQFVPEGVFINWKPSDGFPLENLNIFTKRILKLNTKTVFVGKSPKNSMTLFSGGYGKDFEGNTILLHIKDNQYVFISRDIEFFESIFPIIKYVSTVGNNDVPYPFAVDRKRNYYLLDFGVVLTDAPEKLVMKCVDCCCDDDSENETVAKNPYRYYNDTENDEMNTEKIKITKRIVGDPQ